MAEQKTVTGPSAAMVRTKTDPGGEMILRGQEIPADLLDGEMDRLDKLGVFDPPPAPSSRTAVVAGEVPADTPLTAAGEAAALAEAASPPEATLVEGDEPRRARRTS